VELQNTTIETEDRDTDNVCK